MRTLTPDVYGALCEAAQAGKRPSIRELVEMLDLPGSQVSNVFYALQELMRLGLVQKRAPTGGLYFPVNPYKPFGGTFVEGGGDNGGS